MYKICYCPQCGNLKTYYSNSSDTKHCLECDPKCIPFTKKYKNAQMINTNHKINEWPQKEGEPVTLFDFTPTIYQFFWETYVDIPENDKLDKKLFEKYKQKMHDFFERGGYTGPGLDLRDSKPKSASVVGRAVAGGIIAGPTGAVIGAASAIDKNIREKK